MTNTGGPSRTQLYTLICCNPFRLQTYFSLLYPQHQIFQFYLDYRAPPPHYSLSCHYYREAFTELSACSEFHIYQYKLGRVLPQSYKRLPCQPLLIPWIFIICWTTSWSSSFLDVIFLSPSNWHSNSSAFQTTLRPPKRIFQRPVCFLYLHLWLLIIRHALETDKSVLPWCYCRSRQLPSDAVQHSACVFRSFGTVLPSDSGCSPAEDRCTSIRHRVVLQLLVPHAGLHKR